MTHDVFISYSSKDMQQGKAVCAALEQRGISCWMAPRDIVPGVSWPKAIIQAINTARAMVLVVSSNSNDSPQIEREVERAINKGVPVIPLRIENVTLSDALEYFLSAPHWLEAYDQPLEPHLDRLAVAVRTLLDGKVAKKTDQPKKADQPKKTDRPKNRPPEPAVRIDTPLETPASHPVAAPPILAGIVGAERRRAMVVGVLASIGAVAGTLSAAAVALLQIAR